MLLTVTLNASIDKAYVLDKTLVPGTVMRVKEVRNTAGGKGLNVARVAKLCGSSVIATGFVGGFNGAYLESLLEKTKIRSAFTHVKGETRSCINVLETQYGSTEFLEAGCEINESEITDFIMNYRSLLAEIDVVTLSGSLPKGVTPSIYATLIDLAKKAGKQVILDSSGQSLDIGICAKPTLVKPNKEELEFLFNEKIETVTDTLRLGKRLLNRGVDYVVISLGSDGAVLLHQDKIYQAIPPTIEAVNTVGCGDSMVATLAIGLAEKRENKELIRYAVAVGTANALSPYTGDVDKEQINQIYDSVQVKEI